MDLRGKCWYSCVTDANINVVKTIPINSYTLWRISIKRAFHNFLFVSGADTAAFAIVKLKIVDDFHEGQMEKCEKHTLA